MLLEIHCHTKEHSSCSHVSAVDLVTEVRDKGLQGIVLTDHHYVWPAEKLADLRQDAGLEDFFVLLSGQEVTTDRGDVLVFGPATSIPKHTPLAEIAQRYPDACLVWAHPYRKGARPDAEMLESISPLHGVEIFSSNHRVRDNVHGLQDWHRYKFTALAGTDSHAKGYAGTYPTQFDHWVGTIQDLIEEIRHGRCRPFFKEIPLTGANLLVTEIVVGTKGRNEIRERWIVKRLPAVLSKWKKAERTYRIMDMLFQRGFDRGPYRVPEPLDVDPESRTLIEAGQRGKSLYEKLLHVPGKEGRVLLDRVAAWLATFHDTSVEIPSPDDFLASEERRIRNYLKHFLTSGNPHLRKALSLAEILLLAEKRVIEHESRNFVPGHGDFHPKNILIGQDQADDPSTQFISVIDFENARSYPRAYDVGTFLAQFRNQFAGFPDILRRYPEEAFLDAYRRHASIVSPDFLRQVELFRARTNLSIASYLIKIGNGENEDLWRVLVEAEKAVSLHCS